MEKKKAIALATTHAEFNKADKYFVTTDEKVFTVADKAVSNAMQISAGNPTVIEVETSEFIAAKKDVKAKDETANTDAPGAKGDVVDLLKNTKAATIEKAKKHLDDMIAISVTKETALQNATSKNKGNLTGQFNKAKSNVEAAQAALDLAKAMPDEPAVEE